MNRNNLTKILSTGLSLALAVSSMPLSAGAVGPESVMPAFVSKLTPPEQLGYVATSFAPNNETKPRLIVIADLHAHLEVQQHIEDMLDFFVNQLTSNKSTSSESVAPIFVEGGWTEKLEHPLSRIQNSKLRSTLAQYFMAKSEMPASQAFSERYPAGTNFTLTGVENYDEYQANRERFVKTYPERKRVLDAIARHEQSVNDLADIVEPGAFSRLQAMRKDYLSGKISSEKYTKALLRMASRFAVNNASVETLKNSANMPEGSVDLALHAVHKSIVLAIAQEKPMSAYFRKSIGDESKIRENLALIDTYLDLLKRTLSNQLTPEEVPLANVRIPEMAQVANLLLAQDGITLDMIHVLQEAMAFYPYAIMRDTSLVENSLKALDKNPSQTTGILVAGGFHVGTIADYLQEHHIPYMVVHPAITRDLTTGEEINYVKRMAREHVTLDEMRSDFANGFGQKAVAGKGASAQSMGNAAPEPAGEVKPDPKNPGKLGAFGAKEDELLAAVDAVDANGKPLFVSRASGLTIADGITLQADDAARIDAVTKAIQARGFIEGNIADANVASLGATFTEQNGTYEGTGAISPDLAPVFQVALQTLPENEARPAKVHIQAVSGDAFFKMAAAQAPESDPGVSRSKDAIISGIGTDEVVILVNKDLVPDMKKAQGAIAKIKTGKEVLSAQDNASLQNYHRMSEEIAHALGGLDASQGNQVDAERTGIFLGTVAQLGGFKAGEHAISGGLSAFELPSRVANGSVRALGNLANSSTVGSVAETTRNVANVSLGSIIGKLRANINVEAHQQDVAESLGKQLETNFPELSASQRELIISQVNSSPFARFSSNAALAAKANRVAASMKKNEDEVNPEA